MDPDSTENLLRDIDGFCERTGIAQTTFGRFAVNDGKFVSRVRSGAAVRGETRRRVYQFIKEVESGERIIQGRSKRKHATAHRAIMESMASEATMPRFLSAPEEHEYRQKTQFFVNSCNERWILADRAYEVLSKTKLHRPALYLFDASLGDGTVLTRVLRAAHKNNPTLPHIVVTKARALDDLRNSLGKMADRFLEHPLMVLVVTNLRFEDAVKLGADEQTGNKAVNWEEFALEGNTAYDFQRQISALHETIADEWLEGEPTASHSPSRPTVIMLYRADYQYVLDGLIPKRGDQLNYDFIIAAHLFRQRVPMEFKIRKVLTPLINSLALGGRLFYAQAYGKDPGHEIVRRIWPDEADFFLSRHEIIRALRREFSDTGNVLNISGITDSQSLFRYDMHTLPVDPRGAIGTSTLLAAWNNATFVSQVPQSDVEKVMRSDIDYLGQTADVIRKNDGLWFINESFVVQKR